MAGHALSERDPAPTGGSTRKKSALRHAKHRDSKHFNRMGRIMRGASRK